MSDIQSSTFNGDGHFSGFPDSEAQTLTIEAMRQDSPTLNQLVMNEADMVNDDTNIPQVHPILVVSIGTTQAELLPILDKQLEGMKDLAPWRGVVVDSLPYDDLLTRLAQNGWTRDQVEETIPRSHYLQLISPFTKDFSFDHPLNQDWKRTIFEPGLERLAKNPDAPGCAGTPALARARVEAIPKSCAGFSSSTYKPSPKSARAPWRCCPASECSLSPPFEGAQARAPLPLRQHCSSL
jgi:hypothetical protein